MPMFIQMPLILGIFAALWLFFRRFERPDRPPGVFWGFWRNTADSLRRPAWAAYAAAIALTLILVLLGWDDAFQRRLQQADPMPRSLTWPIFLVGNIWTLAIGFFLLGWGAWSRRSHLAAAGAAALQAVFATFWVVTLLKTLSGRRGPTWLLDGIDPHPVSGPFMRAVSGADFDAAFWHHTFSDGRFFWPSGHTATAVTMVSALTAFYPQKRWIAWFGYPLAAFMGWTMLAGDHHWLSDVLAGALIAHVIGRSIGKSFAREFEKRKEDSLPSFGSANGREAS